MNRGCEPERSQAQLEADEEGREGRMGICNALARQYGCAVRTPLEATVRSGQVMRSTGLLHPRDPRHKESGMAEFVNKPDEYRKKYFTWQENEWRSNRILVLDN